MSITEVEIAKQNSDGLRGKLIPTLDNPELDGFYEDDLHLIKFHGIYQQKNRDLKKLESPVPTTFMVRGRIPGGRLSATQYLKWDLLADQFGGGSIRLTTRQAIQLHGVPKNQLRELMQGIHAINQSTIAACGDVVRNVTQAVNPWQNPDISLLDHVAQQLSDAFKFQSSAWAEVWLGEERIAIPGDELEPIYSESYLPRKFKISITLAGNNSVDLLTNDLGFAAVVEQGCIQGYHVFAGGGMGMTHNKANTYPRLADSLGYISSEHLLNTAQAIVSVHRDFGDRTNRKHARLKYVVQEQGLAWFKNEVEIRQGFAFENREIPTWKTPSNLGWIKQNNSQWALGLSILSGRISDQSNIFLKSAIRQVVEELQTAVQLTPDQDLILCNIPSQQIPWVEECFRNASVPILTHTALQARALACVALPTCSLALAEAERVFPLILTQIERILEELKITKVAPILRVTGCPNGCARPYAAELAIVGMAPGLYAIFLGGNSEGTRLASLWKQKISLADINNLLFPLFKDWHDSPIASFGDFCLENFRAKNT